MVRSGKGAEKKFTSHEICDCFEEPLCDHYADTQATSTEYFRLVRRETQFERKGLFQLNTSKLLMK